MKSEILKVRSTQVWFWMLVLAVALTGLTCAGELSGVHSHEPSESVDYFNILKPFWLTGVALLVLGLLGLTTEYRHKTITPTLLATPNRLQLLLGKTVAYGILSVLYSTVCVVVNVVMASIWLSALSVPVKFGGEVPSGLLRSFLSLLLLGLFGLGLGLLVRNQAAAMVIGLAYLFVLNFILAGIPFVRKAWPYEPGGAFIQLIRSTRRDDMNLPSDVHQYAPAVAGLILLGWSVILLALGYVVSLRRDVS
ncbi:MAG TPA: ABC transporter permease subunit [Jatrophihabitans sp.]|nr:ABC transporter permease subunit [Jatrophihabitans sp.]